MGADLRGADLRGAQLLASNLSGARLDGVIFGDTHLGFTPLINVHGLDQVQHRKMSHIDQFSIIRSVPLPISFLGACGVQSHTIRMAELYVQSHRYLREWLTWNSVPSWFAPQDMRREEFQSTEVELERDLYTYVDEAERVLLVISPNILPSGWVGKEFQRARSSRSFTSVIPILIENMPHPDSLEWNALIGKTVEEVEYSQSTQPRKLLERTEATLERTSSRFAKLARAFHAGTTFAHPVASPEPDDVTRTTRTIGCAQDMCRQIKWQGVTLHPRHACMTK
ncbi:MAG: TIR domain-containing protein [Pseudomonadota bacterium]|nr:TIR domain-containing protein [Pseudomonadota bacterium]